jgi:hypothetical protein
VTKLTDLSHTLWRQRRLLELLQYRLEVQQAMLATGRKRWIGHAAADVESVMDQLRAEELTRAVQVSAVANDHGLRDEPSLRELISAVPSPWDDILREHQLAFLALTSEVEEITKHNRELLTRGASSTRELLAALTDGHSERDGYSAAGASTSLRPPASTIDRVV